MTAPACDKQKTTSPQDSISTENGVLKISLQWLLLAVFAAAALLAVTAIHTPVHPWLFIGSNAIMLGTLYLLVRSDCRRSVLSAAFVFALLIRIISIVYVPASDDINRYIWEGTIQLHGHNPFTTAPNAPETEHLRNAIWEDVNHPHIATIYWPFAQLLFKATAGISPTITAFKILVTLFDLLTLLMLGLIVRHRRLPLSSLLLYALNPLVLVAISGQGHMESIVVFLMVTALYLMDTRRGGVVALLALASAVLCKLTSCILLPFFIRKTGWKKAIWLFVPLLLFIPYLTTPAHYFATPLLFAREFSYNGLLQEFLTHYCGLDTTSTLHLLLFTFGTGTVVIFIITPSLLRASSLVIGLLLLCMPTVHPWYFLLMTPFLVLFQQKSWLLLHFTTLFLLFFFDSSVSIPFFHHRYLLISIEYLPFIIMATIELLSGNKRWPIRYPTVQNISVIIPTRNEAGSIGSCLQSLQKQGMEVETIIVDSGSTDETLAKVTAFPNVRILTAPPGRGIQIAEGIRHAHGDTIVVLHADAQLAPGILQKMVKELKEHTDASGGAMQGRYDMLHWRMRLTEFFNLVRARYFGIAFGDQAQFFRRAALPEGFPEYKLMEDVELSLRLKERGILLYLKNGLICSSRRWRSHNFFANTWAVVYLTFLFLIMRSFGLVRNNASYFYHYYYGKKT